MGGCHGCCRSSSTETKEIPATNTESKPPRKQRAPLHAATALTGAHANAKERDETTNDRTLSKPAHPEEQLVNGGSTLSRGGPSQHASALPKESQLNTTLSKASKFGETVSRGSRLNFGTFSKSTMLETNNSPSTKPKNGKKDKTPKVKTPKLDRATTYTAAAFHDSLKKRFRLARKSNRKNPFGVVTAEADNDLKIMGFSGRQMDTGDLMVRTENVQDYCLWDWGKHKPPRELGDEDAPSSIGAAASRHMRAVMFRDDTTLDSPYTIRRQKSGLRDVDVDTFDVADLARRTHDDDVFDVTIVRDRNRSFTQGVTPNKFDTVGSSRLPATHISPLRSLGRHNTVQSRRDGNAHKKRTKLSLSMFDEPLGSERSFSMLGESKAHGSTITGRERNRTPEILRYAAVQEREGHLYGNSAFEFEGEGDEKYATEVQYPVARGGQSTSTRRNSQTCTQTLDSKTRSPGPTADEDSSCFPSEQNPDNATGAGGEMYGNMMPYENPQFCDVDVADRKGLSGGSRLSVWKSESGHSSDDSDAYAYTVASRRPSVVSTASNSSENLRGDGQRAVQVTGESREDACFETGNKGATHLLTPRRMVLDPRDVKF